MKNTSHHKDDLLAALNKLAALAAEYADEFEALDIQVRLDNLILEADAEIESMEDVVSGDELADILYQNKVGA